MKDSYLISFEGVECSGKSTQIKLFEQFLIERGFDCLVLREPGASRLGEKIRSILLDEDISLSAESELLLFLSSRAQLLKELVAPHLEKNKAIVILDRYLDSSLAYQGGGRGLGVEKVLSLHENFPPLDKKPDITFFLDLNLEVSDQRLAQREKDRMESEERAFFERVHKAYQEIAQKFERIKTINAEQSIENVHRDIAHHWNEFIK